MAVTEIEIEIDNRLLRVPPNVSIIEAADRSGIYIPRFCYHKKLSVAANCRMCLVEVERSGKPLPACATPVAAGMRVLTNSAKAREAQRSVMEFLLINHPLDCPICDQGGECELQDLSLGYGQSVSRFTEGKRSVKDDDLGTLIASEMTRCIQCTRCVRFGQEIAGMKELGTLNRGEDLQIGTFVEHSLVSEISGNMIDLCPVGALTSKPFRFTARAWELTQHPSIAPHDCLGSNVYLHARRGQIMRAVPRENEAINETWLSDRDRYSYLGIHSEDRILKPHIRDNGKWFAVDWAIALEKVASSLSAVIKEAGPQAMGALISPNCTTEEHYLLQKLWRSLGSSHIDHRLHQTDTSDDLLGTQFDTAKLTLPQLEQRAFILLVGSNTRREQPLLEARLRKAQQAGASIASISCLDSMFSLQQDEKIVAAPQEIILILAGLAKAIAGDAHLFPSVSVNDQQTRIAEQLKTKASVIILGAIAHNHPQAAWIRQVTRWIAEQTGAQCIYLTEGANAAGACLAGALPCYLPGGATVDRPGFSTHEMFNAALKAYLLVNIEPSLDCANPLHVEQSLRQANCVVALSSFKSASLLAHADVILPMASFAEIAGSYVNVVGDWQVFTPAIPILGQSKSGGEILQLLGQALGLSDLDQCSHESIRAELQRAGARIQQEPMPMNMSLPDVISPSRGQLTRITEWPLYRSDSLVRRSLPLQRSASSDRVGIRMNAALMKTLKLKEHQWARVKQGAGSAHLLVLLDEQIPDDCVWIPAACEETVNLGESFGVVTIHAE